MTQDEARRELFRLMAENAGEEIYLARPDGSFAYVNAAAACSLGYTVDELLALGVPGITPDHSAEEFRRRFEALKAGPTPPFETVHVARDGRRVVKEIKPVYAAIGSGEYLLGLGRSLTEPRPADAHERRFRLMIENIHDVLVILGRDGTILYESPSVERVLGLAPEERVGHNAFELVHPEDRPALMAFFKETVAIPGPIPSFGFRFLHRDGRYRHLEGSGSNLLDDPAVGGILVTLRDASERVAAEETLRQAMAREEAERKKLEAILSAVGDGISIQDPDYRVLYQNESHRRLIGDHMGEFCYQGYERRENVCPGCPLALAFADGKVHTVERHAGEDSHVEITASVVRDAAGVPLYGVEVVRDIGARFRAERALARSERMHRVLFERNLAGVFRTTPSGEIVACNDAMARIFGYGDAAALKAAGSMVPFYPDPADREVLRERLALHGALTNVEVKMLRRDGGDVWALVNAALVRGEDGADYVEGTVLDITAMKRAEEERRHMQDQLQHTQKLESMGVLAGGIAHDFNNLLVGVLGNADLALMDPALPLPARHRLEEIRTSALRASELTQQMLAYSGKAHRVVKAVDLNRLVEEIAALLEASISKKAALRFTFAPDLPAVEADPSQLRQVVMNLITNASEALGEQNGIISIGTAPVTIAPADLADALGTDPSPAGPCVCLSVSDTGRGMSEATRARIFDPFFSTKVAGRGLGLAVVLGIVRSSGGAIRLFSEPDRGTRFEIYFPASARTAEPEAPEPRVAERGRSATVLVVDDEEAVRDVEVAILEGLGYTVIPAADGREALAAFRSGARAIDAALVDMNMPGMSGAEVVAALRRDHPAVKLLLVSGFGEAEVRVHFSEGALDGFIRKPFRRADLVVALERALDR